MSADATVPSASAFKVNQDSLMIEFDAKTSAKTVNARANCAPGFRLILTVGAGITADEGSSPISGDDTCLLMKLHLDGGLKRASL